ncbi:MAG TPA: RHS repeat-associated core domain-containing protein, partial [Gemmatimonadales bacterium]|nr:RHS repeat-associated core domain-containing protein [Gemmatimonadales bacterium]
LWEGDSTRLYYMRARWYDPSTGRFVSEDPLGLSAGPNQYGFAGGNPVDGRDPSGLGMLPEGCFVNYGVEHWVTYPDGHVDHYIWWYYTCVGGEGGSFVSSDGGFDPAGRVGDGGSAGPGPGAPTPAVGAQGQPGRPQQPQSLPGRKWVFDPPTFNKCPRHVVRELEGHIFDPSTHRPIGLVSGLLRVDRETDKALPYIYVGRALYQGTAWTYFRGQTIGGHVEGWATCAGGGAELTEVSRN